MTCAHSSGKRGLSRNLLLRFLYTCPDLRGLENASPSHRAWALGQLLQLQPQMELAKVGTSGLGPRHAKPYHVGPARFPSWFDSCVGNAGAVESSAGLGLHDISDPCCWCWSQVNLSVYPSIVNLSFSIIAPKLSHSLAFLRDSCLTDRNFVTWS